LRTAISEKVALAGGAQNKVGPNLIDGSNRRQVNFFSKRKITAEASSGDKRRRRVMPPGRWERGKN
jgi:hypothetical protein